jgi:hypothetical protein
MNMVNFKFVMSFSLDDEMDEDELEFNEKRMKKTLT